MSKDEAVEVNRFMSSFIMIGRDSYIGTQSMKDLSQRIEIPEEVLPMIELFHIDGHEYMKLNQAGKDYLNTAPEIPTSAELMKLGAEALGLEVTVLEPWGNVLYVTIDHPSGWYKNEEYGE